MCALTAGALAILSLGTMIARHHVMGNEIDLPAGPNTWKVTLTVQGTAEAGARIWTAAPLECRRQHVSRETLHSSQMDAKPGETKDPRRRSAIWALKPKQKPGPFKLRAEFFCSLDPAVTGAAAFGQALASSPGEGRCLDVEPRSGPDRERLTDLAFDLTAGHERLREQAHALFDYVSEDIANEPSIDDVVGLPSGPVQCLADGAGDAEAKSRLLMTLLRLRGIPARLVTGVMLSRGPGQAVHHWVEAWLHDNWVPMCPFHHHYGKLPATYLVFTVGDLTLVRGKQIRDLEFGFLVERYKAGDHLAEEVPLPRRFFRKISLHALPPAEQRLVQFLLLLPVAALIVCVFRNLIGLISFGTFAPALLGLAFRELASLPGLGVFLAILLTGWLLRRVLARYHLLQVPRVALMLSLVVGLLVAIIVVANWWEMPATSYISLFPLVILVGMIERFWTLEEEDGMAASFRTLLVTVIIAATIALVLSMRAVPRHFFRYPETLGLVMAALLVIGRYTGYRLTELFRFRDFLRPRPELKLAE